MANGLSGLGLSGNPTHDEPGVAMLRKRILLLANSFKTQGRCLAGREVWEKDGRYKLGPWIRPVTDHGEGELHPRETVLDSGREANVRDFVEMPLAKQARDRFQPENWLLAESDVWGDMNGEFRPCPIDALEEHPQNLWFEPDNRSDRISHARLKRRPPNRSICIIRPCDLRLRLFTKTRKNWDGQNKKAIRAVFHYHGVEYDLPVTDPITHDKYGRLIPGPRQEPVEKCLAADDECLLCVSLARRYGEHHYKVVAAIYEGAT